MELAMAMLLKEDRLGDAAYVRRCEGELLFGIESRRQFECWRTGKTLYCDLREGFIREGNRLEIRGKLTDQNPAERGSGVRDKNGYLRWWAGPQLPRPEGPFEVENLPLPQYEDLPQPQPVEVNQREGA